MSTIKNIKYEKAWKMNIQCSQAPYFVAYYNQLPFCNLWLMFMFRGLLGKNDTLLISCTVWHLLTYNIGYFLHRLMSSYLHVLICIFSCISSSYVIKAQVWVSFSKDQICLGRDIIVTSRNNFFWLKHLWNRSMKWKYS